MPNWHMHLIAGVASFFILLFAFSIFGILIKPLLLIFSFFICSFSCLFPDIDSKKSKIYRTITGIVFLIITAFIIAYTAHKLLLMAGLILVWFVSLKLILKIRIRHRGFLHSIFAGFLIGLLAGLIAQLLLESFVPGFFAFIGHFSHLVLDKKV